MISLTSSLILNHIDHCLSQVLVELFDSLEGAMPSKTRKLLVENLKARLDKTKDPAKRAVVAAKIAERIGSNDYWIEYAQDNL